MASRLDELLGTEDRDEAELVKNEYDDIESRERQRAEAIYKKLAKNEKLATSKEPSIGPLNTLPIKKRQRQEERRLTAGKGWFNMPAQELTEEMKDEIRAIQLRSFVNPKKFFKKDELTKFPKYFQIGTVVEGSTDSKARRLKKGERKPHIIDELLLDDAQASYSKRRFDAIQADRDALAKKKMHVKHAIKQHRAKKKT